MAMFHFVSTFSQKRSFTLFFTHSHNTHFRRSFFEELVLDRRRFIRGIRFEVSRKVSTPAAATPSRARQATIKTPLPASPRVPEWGVNYVDRDADHDAKVLSVSGGKVEAQVVGNDNNKKQLNGGF